MCRHIAYVGEETAIGDVLVEPPHSLYRQSWAPRHQRYGTVNADGFGVGWYAPGDREPARYRRSGPVWADPSFADIARVVRTRALLAAVRDITEGCAADEAATAPFAADSWLFSHNGAVDGWPKSVAGVAATLPTEELLNLDARCDSALVWAHVLNRLRAGAEMGPALVAAVCAFASAAPGSRLNLLLTDGRSIAATTWGDTLWYLHDDGRRLTVASEPYDDDPRWTEVPDRTLLAGGPRGGALLFPLKEPQP
jgi:glutamine amidotransferase